jgi:molybdopterin/thiamine biosynthesis adenylyltransferase/rhodanese-related sulfurtransferase
MRLVGLAIALQVTVRTDEHYDRYRGLRQPRPSAGGLPPGGRRRRIPVSLGLGALEDNEFPACGVAGRWRTDGETEQFFQHLASHGISREAPYHPAGLHRSLELHSGDDKRTGEPGDGKRTGEPGDGKRTGEPGDGKRTGEDRTMESRPGNVDGPGRVLDSCRQEEVGRMASPRDLLAQAKTQIKETSPAEAEALFGKVTFLDVREPDENEQGAIPGAILLPRGNLEFQVEGKIPDKQAPVVVYCAGGVRSAFAAQTMQSIGYSDVTSMVGGFNRWKDEGREWVTPQTLTPEQRNRYHRHLLLPEVGDSGQLKLLNSKVLLLGAGGLGSPAALYLAAAGVGTIGIIDMDVVDASNLQRQILHNLDRIGDRKVDSAKKTLTAMNPDVNVVTYDVRLGADNVLDIISGYDVIVDGTDNFPTRYLVNDASLLARVPVVHGSIFRFEGQVTVFDPYNGPCYRCLIPEPPPAELAPSCAEAGVLGVLPGIIGSIQALEAIKVILGLGDPLVGRLLSFDALEESFRTFKVRRDPACPACGPDAGEIVIAEYDELCMPHSVSAA